MANIFGFGFGLPFSSYGERAFTPINLLSSTYSGGTMAITDYVGDLRNVLANVRPIKGGTWNGSAFTTPILSTGGIVSRTAITNKVTARKVNPTDTTNVSVAGSGTCTVVDDSAALAAAGLDTICTTGKVYKIDATAGSTTIMFSGTVGNTNKHTGLAYIRIIKAGGGTSNLYVGTSALGSFTLTNAAYVKASVVGLTPDFASRQLTVAITALDVAYVILPALVESSYDLPAPYLSAGVDVTTSIVSAATSINVPTTGKFYRIVVNPYAAGQSSTIFYSAVDGSNSFIVTTTATTVVLTSTEATVATPIQVSYTHLAGTTMTIDFGGDSAGTALRVNEGAWATSAVASTPQIAATSYIGSNATPTNHFAGYFGPTTGNITEYATRAKAERAWGAIA